MKKFFVLSLLALLWLAVPAFAQPPVTPSFKEITLKVDTSAYPFSQYTLTFQGEEHLAFLYTRENQVAEVTLTPVAPNIQSVKLAPSADFTLLDSIVNVNNEYFKFRVRFKNLTASQFLNFTFFVKKADTPEPRTEIVKLFPHTQTTAKLLQEDTELFIGEEKVFELTTNNLANLKFPTDWVKGEGLEYRLSERNGILRLHVMPTALGKRTLKLNLQTIKPSLNQNGRITYDLPEITQTFTVKGSRLRFLATDKKEMVYDDVARTKGIEILIENNWNLSLQKTYRIEDQEQPGGMLVAELFTRNNVTNNKVLCWLRIFNYHRISEGYLYIKDGDQAKFITNFDVIPKTSIKSVAIMHEGGDWTTNLTVNPGEVISLRIEGEGLQKAQFNFEDLRDITADSTLLSEQSAVFRLRVPINITRKRIGIYNRAVSTGYALSVKEHQRPKPLDFVLLNYGDKPRKITSLASGPIFYEHVLKDLVLSFSPNLIDQERKLYGQQYLTIQVRVTNNRNELIDQRTIENVVICPGDNSPRAAFYGEACTQGEISLNNYLGRKTYDLNEWSKVEIIVSHNKDKYGGEGFSKKMEIVLRRRVKFDTEVSFPAGLLVKNQGTDGYGSFGGISMAMIAQFSFYHPEKINRYRPYKVGAGFLALNAFNFSNNADVKRDLGVVVIGSLYPTTRDTKLSFPLYLGGGYFISKSKDPWFYFLGPGIQVRF
ncbi:hypothetical protein I5M27_03900 [Adhaeribacter sp. BT258]|uniref:Uncharacterized protein n=1 Tax=Adhaeribacter terrigena TaxID=2793070 RepID=A0ABS1BYI4_9BACT|nr:hypothetical protein [Adhaeribacter terrigena]MBK0402113.1 hypothetical protein [Adhaeribacter terrigena]